MGNIREKELLKYIDVSKKYSDEFYEEYVLKFEKINNTRKLYLFIKRLLDLVISFFALIVLFVPFIIIGIAIKLDSKGPVIFKNRRIGKNKKMFNCYKFRSMTTEAPAEIATSLEITSQYVTKVGRFLRITSLDELPQLINVFLGQMSIIGYRPLVPTEENCNEMRERLGVFRMKPGISGFAQVNGRDDVYYKNKAILDAYYVNNANLWFDIRLIFQSFLVVLLRKDNWDE